MRAFSDGGGVQSMAVKVLAAQGKLTYDAYLFSNVGDDSENPETLSYVREVIVPYCAANGLNFVEVRRETNGGETLLQRTLRETRAINIPMRMSNGAPGNRNCTQAYKRAVIHKWLGKGEHVVALGISWDEVGRMRTDSGYKNITNEYPLIERRLTRADCLRIVREAGLPQPPKSSCWFCPFHTLAGWRELQRTQPALYQQAIELEITLNEKRAALGKDAVFLSSKARPLAQSIGDQMAFELEDNCESGYCMV